MSFIDRQYDVFQMFNDRWALATAGTIDNYNTMTIAWGSMGTIWGPPHKGKPILTIYVSPARYTHRFLEENDLYTVSFFPEDYRKDLEILGSKSGRDGDKVTLTDLTPMEAGGSVTFGQADLTFVCKKLYQHQFEKEKVPQEVAEWIYNKMPPHTMFIGEVIDVIEGSKA